MCRSSRGFGWLGLVLMVASAGAPARAQHHERKRVERAEIDALEQQWRQAQLSENIPAMDRLLADEFLGVNASGEVVTKAQQLDRMRTKAVDISRLDLSDTKIKISGNLAVVTSLAHLDGTSMGRPLSGYFRYTRVYQHSLGEGWKITNFEATRVGNPPPPGFPLPAVKPATQPSLSPSSLAASPAGPAFPRPPS